MILQMLSNKKYKRVSNFTQRFIEPVLSISIVLDIWEGGDINVTKHLLLSSVTFYSNKEDECNASYTLATNEKIRYIMFLPF